MTIYLKNGEVMVHAELQYSAAKVKGLRAFFFVPTFFTRAREHHNTSNHVETRYYKIYRQVQLIIDSETEFIKIKYLHDMLQ